MTWSEQFKAYIDTRFGKGSQQETAFALRISPSRVSYWCRGAVPRKQMRRRIERWSKGPCRLPLRTPLRLESCRPELRASSIPSLARPHGAPTGRMCRLHPISCSATEPTTTRNRISRGQAKREPYTHA